MVWQDQKFDQTLSWLLEPVSPGVRYLALRDLVALPKDAPELIEAQSAAHRQGPISNVLAEMNEAGYWVKPGHGYSPKYRSTVWSIILLAQLGARQECDQRIERACAYLLDHTYSAGGQLSLNGSASGTVDCLQGNLLAALIDLGSQDPRIAVAYDWMARTVTGEGIAPMTEKDAPRRYYAYKCGPLFACGANNKLPCAWGGVKVMLAFAKLPQQQRTALIDHAIAQGVLFFLGSDPADAAYPNGYADKPSGNWWKFGFPVFYITDLLQNVEALVSLGCASDPRLARALELIRQKQDAQGRWVLETNYHGKTWVDIGIKKQADKWVTLRALRVLKAVAEAQSKVK